MDVDGRKDGARILTINNLHEGFEHCVVDKLK